MSVKNVVHGTGCIWVVCQMWAPFSYSRIGPEPATEPNAWPLG